MPFDFGRLFRTYSKRQPREIKRQPSLTVEFRARVLLLCRDSFAAPLFWMEIHQKLQYLHGRGTLSEGAVNDPREDTIRFLSNCSDEHFLDFVEMIFQINCERVRGFNDDELVESVNQFFRLDDLPFSITGFVRKEVQKHSYGREVTYIEVAAYPQVIRRESELMSFFRVIRPGFSRTSVHPGSAVV